MAYLVFEDEQGSVLVEVDETDVSPPEGVLKAGISERVKDNLAKAQATFDQALTSLIRGSAGAFVRAVNSLDDVPDQIEIDFGIKATGEVGNLAVGKLSGDANYTVKLTWSKAAYQRGAAAERNDEAG
jgi:hypothetical protein